MSRIQTMVATLCAVGLVPISIAFIDRPIARFCYLLFGHTPAAHSLSGTPGLFGPLAVVVFIMLLLRRAVQHPFSQADAILVLCEISIVVTKLIVLAMKFSFGRTWPLYHHPSFLLDGAYGFNFFKSGAQFESFPSGHAAAVCGVIGVLWLTTNAKFRALYGACVLGLGLALIGGDYHFVSDVVAGALVGVATSNLVVSLCLKPLTSAVAAAPSPTSVPQSSRDSRA